MFFFLVIYYIYKSLIPFVLIYYLFFGLRLEGLAPGDPPVTYRIGFCGTEVATTIIGGLISSTCQSIVFLQTAAALSFHRSVLRLNASSVALSSSVILKVLPSYPGNRLISSRNQFSQYMNFYSLNKEFFTITMENDNTAMSEGIFVFIAKRSVALCDPFVMRHFPGKSWRWLSCYSRPSWRYFLFGVSSVLEAKVSVTPACS